MPRRPTLLLLACVAFIAAGCSSSNNADSANYVGVDPVPTTPASTDPAPVNPAPAEAADTVTEADPVDAVDEVVQVFDDFLTLRAQAITGTADLDQLERVATPAAIDQVAALRTENEALIANDSYAALSDLAEWSNISRVDQLGDQMLFRDCTERQYLTPGGFTVVNFVTNDVSIIDVDGELKVDEITMVQDGVVSLDPQGFGCIPPTFAERARLAADHAVTEAARLIEDPATALEQGLPDVFSDEARVDLEFGLQSLNTAGLSRVADELVTYDVLGLDVNRPDFTAVVSVCRTYLTGRFYIDASGAATTTEVPVGSSYEEWVFVNLSVDGSSDRVVAVEDRGPNCEGRQS